MGARWYVFRDGEEKCRYLDGAAQDDARDPAVRALVARLHHPNPLTFAVRLHLFCRDAIAYAHDAPPEEFAGAGVVLARMVDDCDGKARVFVAACRAYGLPARVRCVYDPQLCPDRPEHFQAEVLIGGRWVLAELTLLGVQLGDGAERGRLDPQGRYLLAAPASPSRKVA